MPCHTRSQACRLISCRALNRSLKARLLALLAARSMSNKRPFLETRQWARDIVKVRRVDPVVHTVARELIRDWHPGIVRPWDLAGQDAEQGREVPDGSARAVPTE